MVARPEPATPDWPLVVENDDGIRPAGAPNECFYCHQRIGSPHARDCVVVCRSVKVRYTFEIEILVPHHWSADDVEFHRNESSWCSDNALDDIEEGRDRAGGYLCSGFRCEVLDMGDNIPHRKIRKPQD